MTQIGDTSKGYGGRGTTMGHQRMKKARTCRNCGNVGHMAKDCWSMKKTVGSLDQGPEGVASTSRIQENDTGGDAKLVAGRFTASFRKERHITAQTGTRVMHKLHMGVDSGSAATIIRHDEMTDYRVLWLFESKNGKGYVTAIGGIPIDDGKKELCVRGGDKQRLPRARVGDAKQRLSAVPDLVGTGYKAVRPADSAIRWSSWRHRARAPAQRA